MSHATGLIGDVKQLVASIEKEIKSFEKDIEDVGGQFTNVDHLRVAHAHLTELNNQLCNRRANVEAEQDAATAPQEPAEPAPPGETLSQQAGIAPLTDEQLATAQTPKA